MRPAKAVANYAVGLVLVCVSVHYFLQVAETAALDDRDLAAAMPPDGTLAHHLATVLLSSPAPTRRTSESATCTTISDCLSVARPGPAAAVPPVPERTSPVDDARSAGAIPKVMPVATHRSPAKPRS